MVRWLAILFVLSPPGWVGSRAASADELPTPDVQLVSLCKPRVIIADSGFAYSPSPVTGSATWTAEYLTKESFTGGGKRPTSWHVDRYLPVDLRANGRDYAGSGFHIGHLAADANVGNQQDKIARAVYSNAVPQAPGLNMGLWAQLEKDVRAMVDETHAVYVVTLPVYFLRSERLTLVGSLIKPTHLAKSVLILKGGGPESARSWLIPNRNPQAGARLENYRCTVDEIEDATQLDLFGFLDDSLEISLEGQR